MAPRQLFTQPMEDDNDPEPGSKRVRPSSTDEGSMQVQLRARASACGTPWPGPAHWLALLARPRAQTRRRTTLSVQTSFFIMKKKFQATISLPPPPLPPYFNERWE
eukprot:scaffold5876_cov129-Isochrysis_galbana.AAC.1